MTKPTKKKLPNIKPTPGYLLCKIYLFEDTPFKTGREAAGEDKMSEVLEVGENVKDAQGILRTAPCKKGDIILSADSNKTFTIGFDAYRFIHFSEVHGIYKK